MAELGDGVLRLVRADPLRHLVLQMQLAFLQRFLFELFVDRHLSLARELRQPRLARMVLFDPLPELFVLAAENPLNLRGSIGHQAFPPLMVRFARAIVDLYNPLPHGAFPPPRRGRRLPRGALDSHHPVPARPLRRRRDQVRPGHSRNARHRRVFPAACRFPAASPRPPFASWRSRLSSPRSGATSSSATRPSTPRSFAKCAPPARFSCRMPLSRRLAEAAVCLVALSTLITPFRRDLFVGDETKYAQVIREMRATGAFFLPHAAFPPPRRGRRLPRGALDSHHPVPARPLRRRRDQVRPGHSRNARHRRVFPADAGGAAIHP